MTNNMTNNILSYNHSFDAGYDLQLNLNQTSTNSQSVRDFLLNFYDSNLHWDEKAGIKLPDLYLNGTKITDFLDSTQFHNFFNVDEPFVLLPPSRVAQLDLALGLANFSNCELVQSSFDFIEPKSWSELQNLFDCLENIVDSHLTQKIPPGKYYSYFESNLRQYLNIVGYVYPRSGLGAKHQITISNNVGVVDLKYRNNVMIALENRGRDIHMFTNGARIAQLVIGVILNNPYQLKPTKDNERSEKGFGSSGV